MLKSAVSSDSGGTGQRTGRHAFQRQCLGDGHFPAIRSKTGPACGTVSYQHGLSTGNRAEEHSGHPRLYIGGTVSYLQFGVLYKISTSN